MADFLSRLGGALGTFGEAATGQTPAFLARQRQQQALQQIAPILGGQTIPAFLRPGGAEPLGPQQTRDAQVQQLLALGTPQAGEVALKIMSTPERQLAQRRQTLAEQAAEREAAAGLRAEERQERRIGLEERRLEEAEARAERADVRAERAADLQERKFQQDLDKFKQQFALQEQKFQEGVRQFDRKQIQELKKLEVTERQKAKKKLTPENAAKVQLVKQGLKNVQQVEDILFDESGAALESSIIAMAAGTPGTQGRRARDLLLNAINAQLRAESGAAVPETEVERAFIRFAPSVFDSDLAKTQKLNNLKELLQGTLSLTSDPTSGEVTMTEAAPSEEGGIREGTIAHNPQTGGQIIFRGGQWQPL